MGSSNPLTPPLPAGYTEIPDPTTPPLPAGFTEIPAPSVSQIATHRLANPQRPKDAEQMGSVLDEPLFRPPAREQNAMAARGGAPLQRIAKAVLPEAAGQGVSNFLGETRGALEGFGSAKNVGILAGATAAGAIPVVGPYVAPAVSGYFAGTMGVDAARQLPEITRAAEERDFPTLGTALGRFAPTVAFAASAAAHGIKGARDLYRPVSPAEAAAMPKAAPKAKAPTIDVEDVARRHFETGGSTTDFRTGKADAGKEGFAVVTRPELTKVFDPRDPLRGIREHLESPEVQEAIRQEPDLRLGTYVMDNGDHVVELSKIVPTREEALALGKQHGQEAIWNREKFESIPVDQPAEHMADAAPEKAASVSAGDVDLQKAPTMEPPAEAPPPFVPDTGTDVRTKRTPPPVPTLEQMEAEKPTPKMLRYEHYAREAGLPELNLSRYGEGALSLAEKKRGALPGIFGYREGTAPEHKVQAGAKEIVTFEIPEDKIRDLAKTPGEHATAREEAIAAEEAAYHGVDYTDTVKSFAKRHEIVARRPVETPHVASAPRFDNPPTLERLSGFLREKEGPPGIRRESAYMPGLKMDMPENPVYVSRDVKGQINGILALDPITQEGGGKQWQVSAAVRPGATVGKDLVRAAMADGHDLRTMLGTNEFTKSGARFVNRLIDAERAPEVPTSTPKVPDGHAIKLVDRSTGDGPIFSSPDPHASIFNRLTPEQMQAWKDGKVEMEAGNVRDGVFTPRDADTRRVLDTAEQATRPQKTALGQFRDNPMYTAPGESVGKLREAPDWLQKKVAQADITIAEFKKGGKIFDVGGATIEGAKLFNAYSAKAAAYIWEHAPTKKQFVDGFLKLYPETKAKIHLVYDAALKHLKEFYREAGGRDKFLTPTEMYQLIEKGDAFWYETDAQLAREKIVKVFGEGADKEMADLAAVLSPNRSVRQSQKLVLEAMTKLRTGEKMSKEITSTRGWKGYLATGEIKGPKTAPFGRNIEAGLRGEAPQEVPVDRHMVHGFGWTGRDVPRAPQREFITEAMKSAARAHAEEGSHASTPGRAQAGFWGGIVEGKTKLKDIKGTKEPFGTTMSQMIDAKHKGDPFAGKKEFGGGGPGLKSILNVGENIRNAPITKEVKQRLGTREEMFQGALGNFRGSEARAQELQMEVKTQLGKLRDTELVQKMTEGLSEKQHGDIFRAVEGIREMDENGNPIFGTEKAAEEGGGVRVDAAEGKRRWDALTEAEKGVVRAGVAELEFSRAQNGIENALQGYIHHYHEFQKDSPLAKARYLLTPEGGDAPKLGHTKSTGQPYKFEERVAGPRRERSEATGHVEHFGKAIEHMRHEFTREREFNAFLPQFIKTVTEPIDPKMKGKPGFDKEGVKAGYTKIEEGKFTRSPTFVGQLGGGRQIPTRLHKEFVRHVEHIDEGDVLGSLSRDIANYSRANMMVFNPASVGKNLYGGAAQYATMVTEHLADAFRTGDFKKVLNDVRGLGDALDPRVHAQRPEALFGARSNVRTQYDRPTSKLGEAADAGFVPFAAVENFYKRAIMQARLRDKGAKKLSAEEVASNRKLLHEVNKEIDTFAFNYHEIPQAMLSLRQSPTGAHMLPFPVYPYKISRLYGRYLAAFNPAVDLTPGERIVRAATLATIAGASIAFVRSHTSPESRDKGRSAVGGGLGMRTVDVPWVGPFVNTRQWAEQLASPGPALDAVMAFAGRGDEFDRNKTAGAIAGDALGTYVPLQRLTKSGRDILTGVQGEKKKYPETFLEAFGSSWPIPAGGKKKGKRLNPYLEGLKATTGVNLQEGHRRR